MSNHRERAEKLAERILSMHSAFFDDDRSGYGKLRAQQKQAIVKESLEVLTTLETETKVLVIENVVRAVDEAEAAWESGNCHEPGCGCVTEYIKRAIGKLVGSELVFDTDKEKRLVAQARLMEFDLIKRERPLDPTYWDKHHRAELELLASKENEAEDSSPATDTQHWPGCPRKGGIGECDCTGDFSGAKP